jgi:hypothetical protein
VTQLISSLGWKRMPLPHQDKGYRLFVVRPVLLHVRELIFRVTRVVVDLVSHGLCDLSRLL